MFGRGGLTEILRGGEGAHQTALDDVTFTVEPGDSLGIIGRNGSGKSTLLKVLAGVTLPSSGHVTVHGRVASLLELGAGFHPMLTGRENVYLNAGLLGVRHAQVEELFDRIVEFSGIGDFIEQPVDTYSSGMYVRIGFAVAAHCNPDIFLVDEVLSVGDEEFQGKCRQKIRELREQGKTIVFVSHDLSTVSALCDRVVLLEKGRMISRGSPKKTIDFYLRRIGRENGIHTMQEGRLESVFSHGRLSMYRDTDEVSGFSGFQAQVNCLGRWHNASEAQWEILERAENRCVARGTMMRLPLQYIWDMRLENGHLVWRVSLECERETAVEATEINLFLPEGYDRWHYGALAGRFPEILSSDITWMTVAPPSLECREVAALPRAGAALPPILATMATDNPQATLVWQNTDHVAGCRVLQVYAKAPEGQKTIAAGRHDLATLDVDFESGLDHIEARLKEAERRRTLRRGGLEARFHEGHIEIRHDGRLLTAAIHGYTSMLIGNLWADSPNLRWGAVEQTASSLRVSGESRRFPFRQDWEIAIEEGRVRLDIWLEALEALEVQEYHTSVLVVSDYIEWETEHERGEFPEFTAGVEDWVHANRNYAPGAWIVARGASVPALTLRSALDDVPFRMTAINAGHHQQARVLQALRTSEGSPLRFEPGRYHYFSGAVEVADA